ncbi:MAG: OmpH family outer membrane protein [Spirochaetaceae bacterium]|jgi:outer membrane protein|nr:OmpH family outer membrane protein [Spirochaetaceae bacterium]
MENLKKLILAGVFALALTPLGAQQITKFGVVDTARVYAAYFRDTGPVKNYETKKADFQKEINRLTEELKNLQQQKRSYEMNGNTAQALKTEGEIAKRSAYLTEYTNAKNHELDSLRKNLQANDEFYIRLYATLSRIAESEGYSMILSLQQANGILWHSPTVDITDNVIAALRQ